MIAEVFIDVKGVEGGAVEAGEEHVDDEEDIDLFVFYPSADVLVIVVKALAVFGGEFGIEHLVVIMDDGFESIAAVGIPVEGYEVIVFDVCVICCGVIGGD